MKNVMSISAKILGLLLLFVMSNLHSQDLTRLNTSSRFEANSSAKTTETTISAQSYTIKGSVIDQDGLPLAGVNVVLKGTREGVVTSLDGKFEFSRQLNANEILIFSYIGYNPQEYVIVADASANDNIKITFDLSDISLMGAVEVEGIYKSKQNIFQKFIGLFK